MILCLLISFLFIFRYAVPHEIKEMEKKLKPKSVDEEAAKFLEKYVNRNPIVTDLPEDSETREEGKKSVIDGEEDEYGNPKDPQKGVVLLEFKFPLEHDANIRKPNKRARWQSKLRSCRSHRASIQQAFLCGRLFSLE